jgi:hypothetical protein
VLVLVLVLSVSALGCSRAPPDATPEGAVHVFLDRMEAASTGAVPMSDVYALLGPATRKNLADRASRAGKIQGRRIDPSDMLAPGRYALKFRPKSMTSQVSGEGATVTVTGYEASETAEVALVRESGAYKVELDLPDVMPLPLRGDGGR